KTCQVIAFGTAFCLPTTARVSDPAWKMNSPASNTNSRMITSPGGGCLSRPVARTATVNQHPHALSCNHMIQTLEWTSSGVRFLDQTKLPTEETYVTCTTHEQVADVIRNMVVREAPASGGHRRQSGYGTARRNPHAWARRGPESLQRRCSRNRWIWDCAWSDSRCSGTGKKDSRLRR